MKSKVVFKTATVTLSLGALLGLQHLTLAADEKAATQSLTGEVVDLMCYLDHGAKGEKHKGCAEKCIKSGGPVGLLSGEQLYLVIGEHKPINDDLASKAAQTVTLKGKVVERNGMKMLENAELEK
ncbi:MAG TPA: hypothetical protein VNZ64_14355 [Candidatus Acidoferrum sp.]|jgi:hypothetical protein|nr:hypothetical protein [Candidatus Acidoferrum sp.]